MTMAARVIYGMARQGDLPRFAGRVHPKTATPLIATALIVAATLTLALLVPFERLAEGTSLATLLVFALVNLSLLRLRHRKIHTPGPHVRVPLWVPAAGLASCLRDDGGREFWLNRYGVLSNRCRASWMAARCLRANSPSSLTGSNIAHRPPRSLPDSIGAMTVRS